MMVLESALSKDVCLPSCQPVQLLSESEAVGLSVLKTLSAQHFTAASL